MPSIFKVLKQGPPWRSRSRGPKDSTHTHTETPVASNALPATPSEAASANSITETGISQPATSSIHPTSTELQPPQQVALSVIPSAQQAASPNDAGSSTNTKKPKHGIHTLYPLENRNPDNITVDIVAVHGLMGDAFRTWTSSDTKKLWLRDFLPETISSARILTFAYDAGVFSRSVLAIKDCAQNLLSALQSVRRKEVRPRVHGGGCRLIFDR
ncbi:hypothetical protein K469DRAFT_357075 [Zopfia rhizophila CBS 207.26]|uniref:DUF676 domain-containing protein n=1 Tax=Zopfia rhizophila CBS 207.26 TaxID=1314779 RepID=A0A6A6DGZ1_9PEZI|nr:hypothetical protein K469DRAFT_357075 [Zopfia rhizophila CBS 207.26]